MQPWGGGRIIRGPRDEPWEQRKETPDVQQAGGQEGQRRRLAWFEVATVADAPAIPEIGPRTVCAGSLAAFCVTPLAP